MPFRTAACQDAGCNHDGNSDQRRERCEDGRRVPTPDEAPACLDRRPRVTDGAAHLTNALLERAADGEFEVVGGHSGVLSSAAVMLRRRFSRAFAV